MQNIIIVDDYLKESLIVEVLDNLKNNNISETWFDKNQSHTYSLLCQTLLFESSKYYDLKNYSGYEFWTQNNTKPRTWHVDKDEYCHFNTGIYKFPICTVVFYLKVNNLSGGTLCLKDCNIVPKTNRLIIFSPGIWHNVEEFTGERVSIIINPWDEKLMGYS
jgi:hypothetical protein